MSIRADSGFNLIEICVCMSIAIILASGLYYGFAQQKHHLERKQAELNLEDIALSLEAHYDFETGYSHLNLSQLGFNEQDDRYEYRLHADKATFAIEARPKFSDICGNLGLDQNNQTYAANESCWH